MGRRHANKRHDRHLSFRSRFICRFVAVIFSLSDCSCSRYHTVGFQSYRQMVLDESGEKNSILCESGGMPVVADSHASTSASPSLPDLARSMSSSSKSRPRLGSGVRPPNFTHMCAVDVPRTL